jgi:hypothetical protein
MPSGEAAAADAAGVLRAIPGNVDATRIRNSAAAAIRTGAEKTPNANPATPLGARPGLERRCAQHVA